MKAEQRAEAVWKGRMYCKAPQQTRIAHTGSWGADKARDRKATYQAVYQLES